jgi:hypothetical protein
VTVPATHRLIGIEAQVHAVVEPIAAACSGLPLPSIRSALRAAWRQAFGGPLDEPALTWCARAIQHHDDWCGGLCGTCRRP